MALFEETLLGKTDKVQRSIDILKSFEPPEGYHLAFSGGKDSQCVYHLAKMAGVKFDAHYSVTSVDPPELVMFIKKNYPDVIFDHHYWNDGKPEHCFSDGRPKPMTMWSVIADHTIPPTRQARYCCQSLKESSGKGRVVVTGVRWAESQNRRKLHGIADIQTTSQKKHLQAMEDATNYKRNKSGGISFLDDNDISRKMVEQCYQKNKVTINPIVDWTEEDVWEFIKEVAKVPYCELYDQGFTRLGCIGCPLQGREGMLADFERWPKYKELYIKAFDKMIANHPGEIKVADGELAKPNGGGSCSESGLLGANDDVSVSSRVVQVERERAATAQEKSHIHSSDSTRSNSGNGGSTNPNGRILQGEVTEAPTEVVVDGDSGRELLLLDRELLSGEAAYTHTHTHTHRRAADARLVDVDAQAHHRHRRESIHHTITAEDFFQYWLWRCRTTQLDWSPHPLRDYDPKAQEYFAESLTGTQE